MSSTQIVSSLAKVLSRAHDLTLRFIDACPDDVWKEPFGGWPVWQHLYHSIKVSEFFIGQPGQAGAMTLFPPDVAMLDVTPDTPPTKEQIKALAVEIKALTDSYLAGLDDAALSQENAAYSARKKEHFDHTEVIGRLATHLFYHLGACDAALRQRGLKGIY